MREFPATADDPGMRPLIGVFTSERHAGTLGTLQRCDEGAPAIELRLGVPVPARDRGRRRAARRARARRPGARGRAARAARRPLPRRRPGPRPARLRRGPAPRPARADRPHRRRRRAGAGAGRRRARDAGARHLPRRPGDERGPRRHAAPARRRPSSGRSRKRTCASRNVAAGSFLAAICGEDVLDVNSFHHQAADRLGAGLRAIATAPDGTVEAIEDPSRPFWLGVQWHAEGMVERPEHLALFRRWSPRRRRRASRSSPKRPASRASRSGTRRRARPLPEPHPARSSPRRSLRPRVVRGRDRAGRVAVQRRSSGPEPRLGAVDVLLGARAHAPPNMTTLSRSTSRMKNARIARRCSSHAGSPVITEKNAGSAPSASAAS